MARPLRIEYPGAVYHVTSRGNARQDVFFDDRDRVNFLNVLAGVVERYNWLCHAYCLMDNHYHLLIETPNANLARGMRQLNGIYTQAFNRCNSRVGHVFQGRYKAIVVEKDSYLLELCRYVVLNPVRARSVADPADWRWSSYAATVGRENALDFLTIQWILAQFSEHSASKARSAYREFVRDGMTADSPWKELRGQVLLGRDGFAEQLKEQHAVNEKSQEVPKRQRYFSRPSLESLFPERTNKKERNRNIYRAYVDCGYLLGEIADHLALHYSTVSKVVKKEGEKKL